MAHQLSRPAGRRGAERDLSSVRRVRPLWPAVTAALVVTAGVVQFSLPINFDVSWYLYGARRLLDGATLYVDWVDPNPPLIVWLSIPFPVVAAWTGLSPDTLLRIGGLVMAVGSVTLSAACLRAGSVEGRANGDPVIMLVAFTLLSVVDHHFFQREHIFLAFVLPYVFASSVRAAGLPLGRALALAAGGVAAVGFALKPFYLLVWVSVEVLLAWRRSPRLVFRPENVAIVAVGLLYAAAILVAAPAYLEIARLGALAYRSYGEQISSADILLDPRAIGSFFLVTFAIVLRHRYPIGALRLVLLALLVGYVGAVLMQGKSFPNHWYPAEATLVLAGYATLSDVWRARAMVDHRRARRLARAAAIGLVVLAALNAVNTLDRWREAYQRDPFYLAAMSAFLDEGAGAGDFFMIGGTMRSSFPLALVTGVPYASRFHSLWLLAGSYPGDCQTPCRPFPYHPPSEMAAAERYQFDAMIEDLRRTRPDVLFVDLVPPQGLAGFDYEEYFSQSPAFRAEFDLYELEETVGGRYRAYRRVP